MKGKLEIVARANLAYLDISVPVDELESLAKSMVGIPVYDSPDDRSVRHVIGKVMSAEWVNDHIEYEAQLNEEGKKLVEAGAMKGSYTLTSEGAP
jgi:hypothetical protein